MGKNPAFLFYPNDWQRDLEEHPLEIEGAWIRICCKLWWSDTKGISTKTISQWSKLLGVHKNKGIYILGYLKKWGVGEIEFLDNQNVTITCRRIVKDEKIRLIRREVGKKGGNPDLLPINKNLVNQSSNQKGGVPVPVPVPVTNTNTKAALIHNLKDKIRKISDVIYHSGKWDKVNAFVNHFKNYNQEALLHTLEQFYKHSNNGRTIEHPWAYCIEIMKIENGNFNEREAIAAHNAIKDITKDFKLSDITKGEKNEKVATKEA